MQTFKMNSTRRGNSDGHQHHRLSTKVVVSSRTAIGRGERFRSAFTIVEVLIAITISLLLMLSLTRAFKYLADQIRENRVQVEISNDLRTINQLISDDLRKMTVSMRPMDGQALEQGYFVYYEGPCTDTTSVMLGEQVRQLEEGAYFGESRFGDIDDYLAFTAYSPDVPFRGVVPRYLLDTRKATIAGASPPTYTGAAAFEPLVIYSNYAEIIYWLQPEYETVPDPTSGRPTYKYDPKFGHPAIAYDENNRFPRKLVLHRRVLLIRPDLNEANGTLPQQTFGSGNSSYVFMQPDAGPRAWQLGMAPVHQQCDLSVRLVLDVNGLPTNRVAANSLADLNKPHNRFGHIRVPGSILEQNPPITYNTMPLLAVGSEMNYLTSAISSNVSTVGFYPSLSTSTPNKSSFNGFLRPEFALGMDLTHKEVETDWWGIERLGEDVLASSVVGFDIQGFDKLAFSGIAGTSDDLAFDANDPVFFEAMRTGGASLETRGTFVDLAYDRLAGGVVRDMDVPLKASISSGLSPAITPAMRKQALTSDLSLTRQELFAPLVTTIPESILRSGKLLRRSNGSIMLFQPTYDTYTNTYESDGFAQGDLNRTPGASFTRGSVWFNPTENIAADGASDGIDFGANGVDDITERETLPPFDCELSQIRIRLRLFDQKSGAIAQQAVVRSIDN